MIRSLFRTPRQKQRIAAEQAARQLQFLRQSVQLEEYIPSTARRLHAWLCVLVAAFITWMIYTPVEEITQAIGEVVPAGFTQVIEHANGGSIQQILAEEGSWVHKGQPLIQLDTVGVEQALKKAQIDVQSAEADVEHTQNLLAAQESLLQNGYTTAIEVLKLRQALKKAAYALSSNQQNLLELQERFADLTIVSPTDGWIKTVMVNTIGQVIKAGQPILEVIPAHKNLVVETQIKPSEIGSIRIGQPVRVKITAYDAYRFGYGDGVVEFITPSTLSDPNGKKYYRARIALAHPYIGKRRSLKILPGMEVQAAIVTGHKTVFAYLIKPIQRAFENSLTEK